MAFSHRKSFYINHFEVLLSGIQPVIHWPVKFYRVLYQLQPIWPLFHLVPKHQFHWPQQLKGTGLLYKPCPRPKTISAMYIYRFFRFFLHLDVPEPILTLLMIANKRHWLCNYIFKTFLLDHLHYIKNSITKLLRSKFGQIIIIN